MTKINCLVYKKGERTIVGRDWKSKYGICINSDECGEVNGKWVVGLGFEGDNFNQLMLNVSLEDHDGGIEKTLFVEVYEAFDINDITVSIDLQNMHHLDEFILDAIGEKLKAKVYEMDNNLIVELEYSTNGITWLSTTEIPIDNIPV